MDFLFAPLQDVRVTVHDGKFHAVDSKEVAFGRRRLLTCDLGDGWGKLCQFLGKSVPATPFPRSNSVEEFNAMFANKDGE